MPTQSFLVQVDCEADEEDVQNYIGEAVRQWTKGNPDLDDPLQTIDNIRVDAVEIHIRRK